MEKIGAIVKPFELDAVKVIGGRCPWKE